MKLCASCEQSPRVIACQVPGCGGLVCPSCRRCGREEAFEPSAHARLGLQGTWAPGGGALPGARATCGLPGDDIPPDLSEADTAALLDLRWHWDEAYDISCRAGKWTARYRAAAEVLTAATASELRALIGDDYAGRRVAPPGSGRSAGHGAPPGIALTGPGERALRHLRDTGVI